MTFYFIPRNSESREVYLTVPNIERNNRNFYVCDCAATALAFRNGANIEEFTWSDTEYTVKRDKRAVVQVAQVVTTTIKA